MSTEAYEQAKREALARHNRNFHRMMKPIYEEAVEKNEVVEQIVRGAGDLMPVVVKILPEYAKYALEYLETIGDKLED